MISEIKQPNKKGMEFTEQKGQFKNTGICTKLSVQLFQLLANPN